MKNLKGIEIDLSLGFNSREIPIELPCHAYATGIVKDYELGELIGQRVCENTPDDELLEVFVKELKAIGLTVKKHSQCRSIEGKTRVIWITRMYIEGDFICRDYHFRLYMQDGSISEKFRSYPPQICNGLVRGEYSLGVYCVEKAP